MPHRKLAAIRAALGAPEPTPAIEHADYRERYAILTGHRIDLCPVCGGCMVEIVLRPRSPSQIRLRAWAAAKKQFGLDYKLVH